MAQWKIGSIRNRLGNRATFGNLHKVIECCKSISLLLLIRSFHPKELVVKSLNSLIGVLHDFNVGKSVLNSRNLLAGSTTVLLEKLF